MDRNPIKQNKAVNKQISTKKPIYKRWYFWVIIVVILIGIAGAGTTSNNGSGNGGNSTAGNSNQQAEVAKVKVADFSAMTDGDIQKWCGENGLTCKVEQEYSDTVAVDGFTRQSIGADTETTRGNVVTIYRSKGPAPTTEQLNALKKAQSYSDNMHMSKARLYKQLTSEYGEKFPADAAQYAVENVNADWNANALETAKSYYNNMSMSKDRVYQQLVSEYGEQFTPEEAQYAIDHLE